MMVDERLGESRAHAEVMESFARRPD